MCISFRSVVQWNSLNVEVKLIKKVHQLKKKSVVKECLEFITEEEENDAK